MIHVIDTVLLPFEPLNRDTSRVPGNVTGLGVTPRGPTSFML
jgi:hypothetical protein